NLRPVPPPHHDAVGARSGDEQPHYLRFRPNCQICAATNLLRQIACCRGCTLAAEIRESRRKQPILELTILIETKREIAGGEGRGYRVREWRPGVTRGATDRKGTSFSMQRAVAVEIVL